MNFGISISESTYTLLHVVISLIAIASGVIVVFGFLAAKRLNALTALFLLTTVLTSVTGFGFPFHQLLPSHIIAITSLVVLMIAILTRYTGPLTGARRWLYVITACLALYFNVFVLVVQGFEKVSSLHALAPTQSEPPFAIAEGLVLVIFIVLTIFAVKKFHPAEA